MRPVPFLGVLMLDTQFPRPVGDVGNPQTYARAGIPVRFLTIQGASPQGVVKDADPRLLAPFLEGAQALVSQGAALITTSCGFLAAYQPQFEAALSVPVLTSSLLMCQQLASPGIVTFDAQSLSPSILLAAGVPLGTPVSGLATGCSMQTAILGNRTELDVARAQQEVVQAALALVQAHPEVQNVVLECTNMPPYREAVALATGRPVHDIETLLLAQWAQRSRVAS